MCNNLIYETKTNNIITYDLSYEFICGIIGIYVCECYPIGNGFKITDNQKNNYLLFKISAKDFHKYHVIYKVLENFKNMNVDILNLYSTDDGKYFFNSECGDCYVVFNFGKGIFKKYQSFNLLDTKHCLKNFYDASRNISEDLSIINNKDVLSTVDSLMDEMVRIEIIISLKYKKDFFDETYLNYRESIYKKLNEAREFFSSGEYISYCEDFNNLRFVHGNLSNRCFVYENEKCFLGNFLNSFTGFVIEDISIMIVNMEYEITMSEIEELLRTLITDFDFKKNFYMRALWNYVNIHNSIFKIIRCKYLLNEEYHKEGFVGFKSNEFVDNNIKFDNFAKNISFT